MRYMKSMMIAMAVFMPMFWSCDVLDTLSKEDDTLTLYWEISRERCIRSSSEGEIIEYYLVVGMEGDQSYAKECEEVGFCVKDADGEIHYQVEMDKDFDNGIAGWLTLPTYLLKIDYEQRLAYADGFSICAYSVKQDGRTFMHASEPIYFIYNHKPSMSFTDASYDRTEEKKSYYQVEYEVDGALWIQGIQMEISGVNLVNEFEYWTDRSDGPYGGAEFYYRWDDKPGEAVYYARLDLVDGTCIYSENHLDVSAYSISVDRVGSFEPSSTAFRSGTSAGAGAEATGYVELLDRECERLN